MVGDDDQSIYRFRGATIENILSFEKQFKGARVIRLEQNYRSTANILAAANSVIRNNQGRKGKELWTEQEGGKKLKLYTAENEHEEGQYVLSQILAGLQNGYQESDFAILYRNNTNSNIVYQTLVRSGIDVYMRHPMTGSAEIRDVMAYLYVIQNQDDDLRLRRILNVPARGIGPAAEEAMAMLAAERGVSCFTVLCDPDCVQQLGRLAGKLAVFRDLILELKAKAAELPLPELYEYLLKATGYQAALEAKMTPENKRRLERLMEFKSVIQDYINRTEENGEEPSLTGFLEEMALDEQLGDQEDEDGRAHKPKEERVQMMTMHGAKGLEFPVVFLIAMEDGIFPGLRTIGEAEEMEEGRRLCYVAMTRAKQELHLVCARQRMLFGHTNNNLPSRFIREIPEELIDRGGRSEGQSQDWDTAPGGFVAAGRPGGTYSAAGRGTASVSGWAAGRGEPARRRELPRKPPRKPPVEPSVAGGYTPPSGTPAPELHKGDMVVHKAFGRGMIVSVQKMGGDALLEIAFDNVGTKRLMAKTAAQHMSKE